MRTACIFNIMAQSAYIIKKPRKFSRAIVAIISVAVLIAACLLFYTFNVYPILKTLTEEEVKSTTTVLMNDAVKSVIDKNISYDKIISTERDGNGNIETMSVNMIFVNDIARNTALITQSRLKSIGEIQVNMPLGTLSGITFLSGLGPRLSVHCLPVGTVKVFFKSDFKSVGINNTLHTIEMISEATVNLVLPGITQTMTVETQVPLVNAVIVGRVPDTYLNSDKLDGMLNLVP